MKRADGNAMAPSPRRIAMGAIGLSLVVFGVVLGFLWTDCLGTPRGGGWECQGKGFSFALLALGYVVTAILSARRRRQLVWAVLGERRATVTEELRQVVGVRHHAIQ